MVNCNEGKLALGYLDCITAATAPHPYLNLGRQRGRAGAHDPGIAADQITHQDRAMKLDFIDRDGRYTPAGMLISDVSASLISVIIGSNLRDNSVASHFLVL